MTATHFILHQYDISPFSQKAQKMMGLKGLAWHSIEMPLIAPKPDVEALTGGYRGTPVLQYGADIYVENWMIARALDHYEPSLPRLNRQGALQAAGGYAWSERFFMPLLQTAFATYKDQWDDDFRADRQQVFPEVDFNTLAVVDPERRSQVRAFVNAIAAQLTSGSDFLNGDYPDGWDVHVWGMCWMIHSALPDLIPVVNAFPAVANWYQQMSDLGVGERADVTIELAWSQLKQSQKAPLPDTPDDEPLRDWLGQQVMVGTGSADRGASTGVLLAVDGEQVVIASEPLEGVNAQVWFPRFGYALSLANQLSQ
jgi:glutathione S-transferase